MTSADTAIFGAAAHMPSMAGMFAHDVEIESKHRNDQPWSARSPEEEAYDIMRASSEEYRKKRATLCPECDGKLINGHCTHCNQRGQ